MNIDITKIYEKSCSAEQHHSDGLRAMRTLSIVQGISIILGSLYLFKEQQYLASIGASIFSILLTIIMASLNYHHLRHTRWLSEYIRKLELEYSLTNSGPFAHMHQMRATNKFQKLLRFLLNSGMYVLIILTSLIILVVNIYFLLLK